MFCRLGVVSRVDEASGDHYLAIHEVFYTLDDKVIGVSEHPVSIEEDDPDDLMEELDVLKEAIASGNVIEYATARKLGEDSGVEEVYRASEELPEQTVETHFVLC
jgi:hypothetical protein